jgi:hypothetical protein
MVQPGANITLWLAAECCYRKLGELVLAAVTDGATSQQAPSAAGDSAGEVRNRHRKQYHQPLRTAALL